MLARLQNCLAKPYQDAGLFGPRNFAVHICLGSKEGGQHIPMPVCKRQGTRMAVRVPHKEN